MPPELPATLQLGNLRRDTAPVFSAKTFAPEPVAPPSGAISAEKKARGAASFSTAAAQASQVTAELALRKQERENKNDTIRANSSYTKQMSEVVTELQNLKGFEARDVQEEFEAEEKRVRDDVMRDLNTNVRDRLTGLFEANRTRGSIGMAKHSLSEGEAETRGATQVATDDMLARSLASGDPVKNIGLHLGRVNDVTTDQMPGMTQIQLDTWKASQNDKAYQSTTALLMADPFDEASISAGVEFFNRNKSNMSADVLNQLSPKVLKQERGIVVNQEKEAMRDMTFTEGTEYIDSRYDGAMREALSRELYGMLSLKRNAVVEEGYDLVNSFNERVEAYMGSASPDEQRDVIMAYDRSLTPDQREAFGPHRERLLRQATVDQKALRSYAMDRAELYMFENPSAFGSDEFQQQLLDSVKGGYLSPNDYKSLQSTFKSVFGGTDSPGVSHATSTAAGTTAGAKPKGIMTSADILKSYIQEVEKDEDNHYALRLMTNRWFLNTGHTLDPTTQVDEGMKMVDFFMKHGESDVLAIKNRAFEQITAVDTVFSPVPITPEIQREVLERTEVLARQQQRDLPRGSRRRAARGEPADVSQEEIRRITMEVLYNSEDTPQELRDIFDKNVVEQEITNTRRTLVNHWNDELGISLGPRPVVASDYVPPRVISELEQAVVVSDLDRGELHGALVVAWEKNDLGAVREITKRIQKMDAPDVLGIWEELYALTEAIGLDGAPREDFGVGLEAIGAGSRARREQRELEAPGVLRAHQKQFVRRRAGALEASIAGAMKTVRDIITGMGSSATRTIIPSPTISTTELLFTYPGSATSEDDGFEEEAE